MRKFSAFSVSSSHLLFIYLQGWVWKSGLGACVWKLTTWEGNDFEFGLLSSISRGLFPCTHCQLWVTLRRKVRKFCMYLSFESWVSSGRTKICCSLQLQGSVCMLFTMKEQNARGSTQRFVRIYLASSLRIIEPRRLEKIIKSNHLGKLPLCSLRRKPCSKKDCGQDSHAWGEEFGPKADRWRNCGIHSKTLCRRSNMG